MPVSAKDDELERLLEKAGHESEGLTALFYRFAHAVADHIQLANEYLPRIQAACERWVDEDPSAKGIALLSEALGNYYSTYFDKVIHPAEEAILLLTPTGNKDLIGSAHMVIGVNYRSLGEVDDAVEHLHLGAELIDPKGPMAVYACYCFYQLAEINVYINDNDAAKHHYLMAAEMAESINQQVPLFRAYNGLGNLYMAQGDMEDAKKYLDLALSFGEMTESQTSRGLCDLGNYYIKLGAYDEAIAHLEKSYAQRKHAQLEDAASTSLISLAEAKIESQRVDEAIADLNAAMAITDKFNSRSKRASALRLLWKAHASKSHWQEANAAAEQYDALHNALSTAKLQNIYKLKNRKIEAQRELLEEKNKEITDSITYAKRIQEAILPPLRNVLKALPNSFVLYKPKDIVAGDFYWMESLGDWVVFAAADCTGHGVPGAMVSVVCNNALNRSVREFGLDQPAAILDKTLELVLEQFESSDEEVKDGMDIALCALNTKTRTLQYAGAQNPLWIKRISSTELEEIKPDKQPIGKYSDPKPFTNHTLQLEAGDTFYIFSDGYADQFGGPKGKKLKYKPFKELLLSINSKAMEEQKQIIDHRFEAWKGDLEQVDDVCVIGVRV
ncbi:MAG: SpoIIE family protein phosphatase [Flavobacteriales bacterium]|nr:SpoIIE family protein phosphatase [Flavobacteriales bacterium]